MTKEILLIGLLITAIAMSGCIEPAVKPSLIMDKEVFEQGEEIVAYVDSEKILYVDYPHFEVYRLDEGEWKPIKFSCWCVEECSAVEEETDFCDYQLMCEPLPESCSPFDPATHSLWWDQKTCKVKSIECPEGQTATCSIEEQVPPGTYKFVFNYSELCINQIDFLAAKNNIQTIEKQFEVKASERPPNVIPVPDVEVFEISGGECPIPEPIEGEFGLPEGCRLLEEPEEFWFSSIDVSCDNTTLLDLGCIYSDENDEIKGGGSLVKTSLTDKTLIECAVPGGLFEGDWLEGETYLRAFDYHPGPYILSFYLGYDDSTKELVKITSWDSLFSFTAPIDSAEKVWGGIRLASSDGIYCYFKSEGYPPWPPEGYEYEEEIYTFEEFLVPKEEIRVSSVEAVPGGFKAHLLLEGQGCPCFINYSEFDVEISAAGEVTKGEEKRVYSAHTGCIC